VYKNSSKSYNDLPLRMGELGVVHRQELSGVLSGLFRVIKFTQDDAHIYCTEEQMEQEIMGVIDLAGKFYSKFGLPYHIELSTRPEKRIGSDAVRDRAEAALKAALDKNGIKYKVNEGDGAFYGPKIDFHIKDSLGRTWQCGTVQLDFSMPERFDLSYKDRDNTDKRPVMLHRVIYGSMERFIGILLEHTNGSLPLWLCPIQVRFISFTERNVKAAEAAAREMARAGLRVDTDLGNNTVNYKVRDAEMQKIPYIIVIGDKEEEAKTYAVRVRGEKKIMFGVKPQDFIRELAKKSADFE
jgi:threonyl-tRNA synthetase